MNCDSTGLFRLDKVHHTLYSFDRINSEFQPNDNTSVILVCFLPFRFFMMHGDRNLTFLLKLSIWNSKKAWLSLNTGGASSSNEIFITTYKPASISCIIVFKYGSKRGKFFMNFSEA